MSKTNLLNHQKIPQSETLVHLTSKLNGWIDNLRRNVSSNKSSVNSQKFRGVDLPGVEPGRLGLSIQPSEPAKPTPKSVYIHVKSKETVNL